MKTKYNITFLNQQFRVTKFTCWGEWTPKLEKCGKRGDVLLQEAKDEHRIFILCSEHYKKLMKDEGLE
jgi:hypothetical protein